MFRTSTPILATRLGNTPEDCARMGIEHGVIKPWEDGMRTDVLPAHRSGAETFSASTESCEVHIGDSVFAGDLHTSEAPGRRGN